MSKHLMNYQGMFKISMKEDALPPVNPIALFYGEPGAGKTTLGVTCGRKSFLWNFNEGAHRSVVRADATGELLPWATMQQLESNGFFEALRNDGFDCLVYDTVDDLIWKTIVPWLYSINSSYATARGQLQMYGALKKEFQRHFYFLRSLGFTIVFVAHQKSEGNRSQTDNLRVKPLITGGSYDIVMSAADCVGFLYSDAKGQRVASFSPTADYYAKNPLQLQSMVIPNVDQSQPVPTEFETFGLDHIIAPIREITQKMSEQVQPVATLPGVQSTTAPVPTPSPSPDSIPPVPTPPAPMSVQVPPQYMQYVQGLTLDQMQAANHWVAQMQDPALKETMSNLINAKFAELGGAYSPNPPAVPQTPAVPASDQYPNYTPGQDFTQLAYQLVQIFKAMKLTVNDLNYAKVVQLSLMPAAQAAGLRQEYVNSYPQTAWENEIFPVARKYFV